MGYCAQFGHSASYSINIHEGANISPLQAHLRDWWHWNLISLLPALSTTAKITLMTPI